jgi:hypothetical protein
VAGSEDRHLAKAEAGAGRQGIPQSSEVFIVDVDDPAAGLADEVVVGDLFLDLEEPTGRPKMGLAHQAEPHQKLQGAVYRGEIHVREGLLNTSGYLLSAQVRVLATENVPDERALGGKAIALLLQGACGVMAHSWLSIAIANIMQ